MKHEFSWSLLPPQKIQPTKFRISKEYYAIFYHVSCLSDNVTSYGNGKDGTSFETKSVSTVCKTICVSYSEVDKIIITSKHTLIR